MTEFSVKMSDSEQAALLIKLISSMESVEQITITEEDDNLVESVSLDFSNGINSETIEPYIGPEYPQMLAEETAFEHMLPELLEQYRDQFVAIHNQQIVDHDDDELKLVARINIDYPEQVVLIRQVSNRQKSPIFFRSPRFAR